MSDSPDSFREAARNTLEDSGSWTRRAGWFLAVVLFMGLALLVYLLGFKHSHHDAASPSSPVTVHVSAPVAPVSGAAPSVSSDKGCAGVTPNNDPATKLPNDVSWQPVGIDSAPVSKSVGPMKIQGHYRMCYAHTPTGAAFASLNILIAAAGYNDAAVVEKQETPGPGKNESLQNQSEQTGSNSWLAYHVDSYDGTHAVVSMVLTVGSRLAVMTQPMVWTNGDWYVDGQPTGVSVPQAVIKTIPKDFVTITTGNGVGQ